MVAAFSGSRPASLLLLPNQIRTTSNIKRICIGGRIIRWKFQSNTASACTTIETSRRLHDVPSSKIPPPTWSLKDLALTKSNASTSSTFTDGDSSSNKNNNSNNKLKVITDEELRKLSTRCLIDTENMGDDERQMLKVELANIMRCISLVSSFEGVNRNENDTGAGAGTDINADADKIMAKREEKEAMMYDVPRGFSLQRSCPLRIDDHDGGVDDDGDGDVIMEEARYIFGHLKDQGKMIVQPSTSSSTSLRDDGEDQGEWYFSVPTEKKNN